MRRLTFLALITLTLLIVHALPTHAHGYVVRAIPEDRATLERPPTRLQYWFSEDLEPRFSEIHLRDQSGNIITSGAVDEQNRSLLALRIPPGTLDDGAYIVELRPAFASDGHVIVESRVFFVGDEVGGVQGAAASDLPVPLEIFWKALLYAGTTLLLGVTLTYTAVLLPAWGSAKHPAGGLPLRVMQRLNRIMWAALGLTLVANLLALLQQSMVFFGVDAGKVLSGGLWQVVRIGSRFGDVWDVRMLLLVVLAAMHAASVYYRREYPGAVRRFWLANVWGAALIVGVQAVNSHAAGSLVLPWVAVLMHWLHTLAVAFWVGGVVVLALVLPVAMAPYEGDARRQALLAAMRRFSRLVIGALALVITTGMYNATNWFFTPNDVTTTYGASLAFKLLLLALLLVVAGMHHLALNPGLMQRLASRGGWLRRAGAFGASLRIEAALALMVLASAALLSATPVPEPDFAKVQIGTPSASTTVGDFDIGLGLAPGGPGVNTFDVVVERDGAPVADARIELQIVNPARGIRSAWLPVEAVDVGLYVTADASIDAPGTWWTLLDVRMGDVNQRAAFAWDIRADAAVIERRGPSMLNLAALMAVLGVILWLLAPMGQAVAARLDWHPTTLLAALGGGVLFLVVTVGGTVFVVEQQRVFNETIHPRPDIVNPVLPDAASLARGEVLYRAHCLGWQREVDFRAFLRNLPRLRDADVYAMTQNGWRDLPPCTGDLSDAERWDVVNYARTLRVILGA